MNGFRRGATLELTTNAHAIPAGRYRFLGEEEQFLIFAVGRKILFGLSRQHWGQFLVPRTSKDSRTSPTEFLDRYYQLIQVMPSEPYSSEKLTFCAVDPTVMSMAA
jgi:hypothetical protein